ncbi:hypothetical protein JCM10908_004441 [Rhodotorula pacifica]|uniref:uncharacterized protein n=1 Tax=Rhodotorula pacifica TaxID=1495444 RepID=UPI0031716F93
MAQDGHVKSEQTWMPPTPQSTLTALPTSTLPMDHLVLLPPPALPLPSDAHEEPSGRKGTENASTPAQAGTRDWLAPAQHGRQEKPVPRDQHHDHDWFPPSSLPHRPRRSAAIAAARNIPRQPSPFDLEDDEDEEADEQSPSISPPPTSSSRGAGGGAGSSKRKVSHSLIERRRREKINECLATLRETVPSLREEGERKLARAKERGRKRGRGEDAGERGGLHKLEILQGTIAYIEDLRTEVSRLQQAARKIAPPGPALVLTPLATAEEMRQNERSGRPSMAKPRLATAPGVLPSHSRVAPSSSATSSLSPSTSGGSGDVDDHEASLLLLNFSTSPELRPVL